MKEKEIVKTLRTTKIVHLCVLFLLEITFFLILVLHPALGKNLYTNPTIFLLSVITWILMLFSLLCVFIDLWQIRTISKETHALHCAVYLDRLTGIPNRHGLDAVFMTYSTPESMSNVGCFMVTISNLQAINQEMGHHTGDLLLQNFSSIFEEIGDNYGVVGRNGGNDFLLVVNNCTSEIMEKFTDILNAQIAEYNKEHTLAPLEIASAYLLNTDVHANSFIQLLTATYDKLHS